MKNGLSIFPNLDAFTLFSGFSKTKNGNTNIYAEKKYRVRIPTRNCAFTL